MTAARHILVVAHTGSDDSLTAAVEACRQLTDAGATPVLPGDQWDDLHEFAPELDGDTERLGDGIERPELPLQHCKLRQRAGTRRGIALFHAAVRAGGSGDHTLGAC